MECCYLMGLVMRAVFLVAWLWLVISTVFDGTVFSLIGLGSCCWKWVFIVAAWQCFWGDVVELCGVLQNEALRAMLHWKCSAHLAHTEFWILLPFVFVSTSGCILWLNTEITYDPSVHVQPIEFPSLRYRTFTELTLGSSMGSSVHARNWPFLGSLWWHAQKKSYLMLTSAFTPGFALGFPKPPRLSFMWVLLSIFIVISVALSLGPHVLYLKADREQLLLLLLTVL